MTKIRGNSLVSHPFRKWYDELIMEGLPTAQIYVRQSERIPPELQVSKRTITEYRENILKPNKEVVKQYKEMKEAEAAEELHQEIVEGTELQEIIEEKAVSMMEADKNFLDMHEHIKKQITGLANIDDPKTRAKIDVAAAIGNLCDQWRLVTMDYLKIQGQLKDNPQTQINIIHIEQKNAEIDALKTTIVDIIQELDPSLVPKFYSLLAQRMQPIKEAFDFKRTSATDPQMSEHQASKAVQALIQKASAIKKE